MEQGFPPKGPRCGSWARMDSAQPGHTLLNLKEFVLYLLECLWRHSSRGTLALGLHRGHGPLQRKQTRSLSFHDILHPLPLLARYSELSTRVHLDLPYGRSILCDEHVSLLEQCLRLLVGCAFSPF